MATANNIKNKSPNRPLYKQKKEGPSTMEGKIIVDIEVCQNCKDHQWCTRHDEAKYNKMFEEVRAAILLENPDVLVTQNNFVQVPTLGAFEVTCMGALLYSKNRSGCFPHGSVIANLIRSYLIDKENGKPTNHYDLRQIESNPNKEDAKYATNSNFRKSQRSPPRSSSGSRGTRGRNSHYSGKGNCIESYQFVISSTFGQGKRSPDERKQSAEKSLNMNSTVQSGFYNSKPNQIQPFSENGSIKGEERLDSKASHRSKEEQIDINHEQQHDKNHEGQFDRKHDSRQSGNEVKQNTIHSNGDHHDQNQHHQHEQDHHHHEQNQHHSEQNQHHHEQNQHHNEQNQHHNEQNSNGDHNKQHIDQNDNLPNNHEELHQKDHNQHQEEDIEVNQLVKQLNHQSQINNHNNSDEHNQINDHHQNEEHEKHNNQVTV